MTRIAVTGHRDLSPHVSHLIDQAIRRELAAIASSAPAARAGDLVGLSCLADGADQIFAAAVLDAGGTLEVIVPALHYRDRLPRSAQASFDDLCARAGAVSRLHHVEPTGHAYMDASIEMLRTADRLFAVWDGRPARAYGGTADVVKHALTLHLPVTVIWPDGATRGV